MTLRRANSAKQRLGAALLVVLATLLIALVAISALARAAGNASLQRRSHDRQQAATDLLSAAESVIQHWLEKHSASVVLPPDVAQPAVDVLHDRIQPGEPGDPEPLELHLRAFDQCGMVPLAMAQSGSPLRLALTAEAAAVVDAVALPPNQVAGLDMFAPTGNGDTDRFDALAVFPDAEGAITHCHGDATATMEPSDASLPDSPFDLHASPPSVGSLIATHNSARTININTASPVLIEQAMRVAGYTAPGGLEAIVTARAEGKPAVMPITSSSQPGDSARDVSHNVRLAAISTCWSFRIDACAGPLRQSWWAVYQQTGSKWECVQRLAITE